MLSLLFLAFAFIAIHADAHHNRRQAHHNPFLSRNSNNNGTVHHFGATTPGPGPSLGKRASFTWFDTGLGACGGTNVASDFIVALPAVDWDGGAHCFADITITINGKSAQAQIVDECMNCPSGNLDFSTGLFQFFEADYVQVGQLNGEWVYGNGGKKDDDKQEEQEQEQEEEWKPESETSTTTKKKHKTKAPEPTSTWTPEPEPTSTSAAVSSFIPSSSAVQSSSTVLETSSSAPSFSSSSASAIPSETASGTASGTMYDLNLALVHLGNIVASH